MLECGREWERVGECWRVLESVGVWECGRVGECWSVWECGSGGGVRWGETCVVVCVSAA